MTTQNVFLLGDLGNMSEASATATRYCTENNFIYTMQKYMKDVDTTSLIFPVDAILQMAIDPKGGQPTTATGLVNEPTALIQMSVNGSRINYSIAAPNREGVEHWSKEVENWSESRTIIDGKVNVSFWAMGAQGPQQWERKIEVPTWEEIRENYANDIQLQLDRIIKREFTGTEGKLALLHGPPGSGKTYAIRALLQAWRESATFSYVVDPERFLNAQPSYMLQLVLDNRDRYNGYFDDDNDDQGVKKTHYHLLIMEDTGELLSADAKDRAGQGLSRLLNLVDGMIGQGINLIVLITTNEHINSFHPAVTRDGRCLAIMEIDKLSVVEANAWLRKHGSTERVREDKTLAELYAITNKSTKPTEEEVTQVGQYL